MSYSYKHVLSEDDRRKLVGVLCYILCILEVIEWFKGYRDFDEEPLLDDWVLNEYCIERQLNDLCFYLIGCLDTKYS